MKRDNFIIIGITLWQFVTGMFLLIFPQGTLQVASLGVFSGLFPNKYMGGALLIMAAVLVVIGLAVRTSRNVRIALFFPQHFFVMLVALSSANYVITERYADGVQRFWPFILIDQLGIFILASLYTILFSILIASDSQSKEFK